MQLDNPGVYAGTCDSIGLDSSKNGTPLFDVVFNVTHVSANGEWQQVPSAMQRHVRIYLSEKAYDSSVAKLTRLGFNGDFDHPVITGESVVLDCYHEEYNNKTQAKWELQYEGRERKAPPADVVRKLAARYKTASTLNPAAPTAPPTPPALPPSDDDDGPPPPSDDDVPGDVDDNSVQF